MPEYLAPGVFVEERPASLRAIEGVSTSTAAFVGPAERGPVAGNPPPFEPENGFVVEADPTPVLVTSYSQYVREFGNPLRLPIATDSEDRGYLGHAVRAFFENGGKRLYISRVIDTEVATRNSLRLGQGTVLRLIRTARSGDTLLSLSSLRGIDANATLNIRRRSDGSDALVETATPAILEGAVSAPFAMSNGDTLTVQITGAGPLPSETATAISAAPAEVTSASGPFNIAVTDTLEVRTGGAAAPVQTATFNTVTAGNATASEVALVLARDIAGVSVEIDTNNNTVTMRSDVSGTDGYIEVVGGTAGGALGFGPVPALGGGNVSNLAAVTVPELLDLFPTTPPAAFALTTDSSGQLRLASNAAGAGVSITVSGATTALGLAGVPEAGQGGGTATAPTVDSYDTQAGTLTLKAPLPMDLDSNEIYVEMATPGTGGPMFHARSPGRWSSSVQVNCVPSDRVPVAITTPAPGGAATIQVRSVTSFYVGAIIEIDHDGQSRSAHELMDISSTTLTIAPPLGTAVGSTAFARVLEIDVSVTDASGAAPDELYRGLSWNPRETEAILRRHYATQINARSRLVYVQPPGIDGLSGSEGAFFTDQPTTPRAFPIPLSDTAVDGIPQKGAGGDAAIVGEDLGPGRRTGIQAFADVPEINIVAAPGRTDATVQLALIAHCELMRYRFAVLDGEQDPGSVNAVQTHRNLYDTSYAGYYAPWIGQNIGGEVRYLPPSGFAAGIYARVDNQRGVWKAPANEVIRNAFSLRTRYTTGEQEILNPRGVNLIRRFEPGGIRVWGARTLSSNPEVRYINVRRTLLFLEASVERGTQWVVFEPNTPETWSRVAASVRSFLRTQWREGALFGRGEDEAFFVRCDESTMTADDVLNGRLICRIGVAIVRPAEFVIFRIEQLTGFAES